MRDPLALVRSLVAVKRLKTKALKEEQATVDGALISTLQQVCAALHGVQQLASVQYCMAAEPF